MKKILTVILCAALLLSLTACSFMPSAKVKKAVKEFGTPQAEMTLSFKAASGKNMKYVIVYDLLLDKTPITTINFINLVEAGFYQDAILETYSSTLNYFKGGSYTYRADVDDEEKLRGYVNDSGVTFVGEFKSNGYKEPDGGYAEFSLLSLAMFHNDSADNFNSANGSLILSTSATTTLNANNYAVFATVNSISVYSDDKLIGTYDSISGTYREQLVEQTAATAVSMKSLEDDTANDVQVLGSSGVPRYIFSIKMLGDKDWSKLPKVN